MTEEEWESVPVQTVVAQEEEYEYSWDDQDLRILKSILSDKNTGVTFAFTYSSDFFRGKPQEFSKLVIDYIRAQKSLPTQRILNEKFPSCTDLINSVYVQLNKTNIDLKEFEYDLQKLKTRQCKEEILKVRDFDFNSVDLESSYKYLKQQTDKLNKIREPKGQQYIKKSGREYIDEFSENYARKLEDPNFDRGVLTGYSYLDYVTRGLREAELFIIAGQTSSGKSVWLNNMAVQMWQQNNLIHKKASRNKQDYKIKGRNVLYFSLEMPLASCFRRTMAKLADVSLYGLRDATLDAGELKSFWQAKDFFKDYPWDFEIVDLGRGASISKIEEIYNSREYEEDEKPIIFLDYLGLVGSTKGEDDWLAQGLLAGEYHEFLRANGLIGATGVQLTRVDEGKKAEPGANIGLHRIGRSSLIAHHANIVAQIETRKNEKNFGDFIYHLIKNRDGELGSHTVGKNFAHGSIADIPYQPDTSMDVEQNEQQKAFQQSAQEIAREMFLQHLAEEKK